MAVTLKFLSRAVSKTQQAIERREHSMKAVSAVLLLAVGASALPARSPVRGRPDNLESAPYTVVREAAGYEERMYPAQTWVCAAQMNRRSGLFMKMFRYISGINSQNQAIPMTRPVTTLYEPMEGGERKMTMCFYLNGEYQGDAAPQPTEEGVFLESRPDLTVIAMRKMSDEYYSEVEFEGMAEELKAAAQANGETGVDFSKYYRVGYDGPMVRKNRRHEVWYVKTA